MEDRAGILREYERWLGEQRWMNRPLSFPTESVQRWRDLYDPELVHRWRVTLDCGCATEALTLGPDHPPTEGLSHSLRPEERSASRNVSFVCYRSRTMHGDEMPLWEGRLWCGAHDTPCPWREIAEWVECVEKEHTWTRMWEGSLEHHGPRDRWSIKLSCGHRTTTLVPVGWLPEHSHRRDPGEAKKLREFHEGRDQSSCADGGRWYRDHLLPWTEDGCPEPLAADDCHYCAHLRRIVSYEPIGPLTWPGDSARPSHESLTKQLRLAEIRVAELAEQLAAEQAAAAKLRGELK